MGLMSWLFGGGASAIATGVKEVAEVFRPNAEASAAREHEAFAAALRQYAAEYGHARPRWFDGVVDALNRLPRPALALGCLALFGYAMADPIGFAARMQGLQLVPDPLWWLLGAIVSFYFGARELHYLRENRKGTGLPDVAATVQAIRDIRALAPEPAPPRTPEPVAGPLTDAPAPVPQPAPEPAPAGPGIEERAPANPALGEFLDRAA